MATAAADLFGVVAYPSIFDLDRALEEGSKVTTSTLATGRVVVLPTGTGTWATGTSGSSGRAAVIPKLYWGKNVNSAASDSKVVVLTGEGAEVYVETSGTIRKGDRVAFDDGGKVKAYTSGVVVGHYVGHYGEASGAGETVTDAIVGEAIRIRLGGN